MRSASAVQRSSGRPMNGGRTFRIPSSSGTSGSPPMLPQHRLNGLQGDWRRRTDEAFSLWCTCVALLPAVASRCKLICLQPLKLQCNRRSWTLNTLRVISLHYIVLLLSTGKLASYRLNNISALTCLYMASAERFLWVITAESPAMIRCIIRPTACSCFAIHPYRVLTCFVDIVTHLVTKIANFCIHVNLILQQHWF